MGKILDYHCSYDTVEQTALPEAAYRYCGEMIQLAKLRREQRDSPLCVLPFCHTLEAEALGAEVSFGGMGGARVRTFRYHSLEELNGISLNIDSPRLKETIAACKLLQEQGEKVLFQISGPLTILGNLLPPEQLFRALRKQPQQVLSCIMDLGDALKQLICLLENEGISSFSYADPSGGLNLIGPVWTERIAREFTWKFLQQLDAELQKDTLFFLCPKTAFALLGCELAKWQEHTLPCPLSYHQAALSLRGKARFVGQSCVNRRNVSCEYIKELKLEESSC